MKWVGIALLSLIVISACLALVPAAVQLGLLILGTNPNPRHPPIDVLGEATGWAVIGALSGALSAVIGESVVMHPDRGFFVVNKGLIIGATVGIIVAGFLGMNFAVLQMDSVDGQAITTVNLGIISGAVVATLGAVSGIIIGVTIRRLIIRIMT